MRNAHRDSLPAPQASLADSPAFRAWQKRTAPTAVSEHPGSGRQGSGCGGYGLGLISADEASQERIRAIMRNICEREQQT